MEYSLKLHNVSTGYKSKVVTADINAELLPGELTCLLGPNGAGKSTLLKTLCTFMAPIAGQITVNDKNIENFSAKELAQTIGIVLTERPSAVNMTVEELVGLGRTPYTSFWGELNATDQEIVDHAIKIVGIEPLRKRRIHTLSDGERQKALIAKTLAQETPIVFLDEPTSFLDYPSKVDIMKLLHRIAHEKNATVMMSTHDIDLALKIADRAWLLDKPHGLTIGTPQDLSSSGAINTYFDREGLKYNVQKGSFEIN